MIYIIILDKRTLNKIKGNIAQHIICILNVMWKKTTGNVLDERKGKENCEKEENRRSLNNHATRSCDRFLGKGISRSIMSAKPKSGSRLS